MQVQAPAWNLGTQAQCYALCVMLKDCGAPCFVRCGGWASSCAAAWPMEESRKALAISAAGMNL